MGSDSDLPVMQGAIDALDEFDVPYEVRIISAHRTPPAMYEYAHTAAARGLRVIVAGAGGAARLPGHDRVDDAAAGDRRPGAAQAPRRARLAALDRADARGHPGRDRGRRQRPQRGPARGADPRGVATTTLRARMEEFQATLAATIAEKDARVAKEHGG